MRYFVGSFCILMGLAGMVFGEGEETATPEPAAKTWQQEAVVQLDMDEFDEACKIAKTNRKDDPTQCRIILMAADLRRYDHGRDKKARSSGLSMYKDLSAEVSIQDADLLTDIHEVGGQQLQEYVGKLLDQALKKVSSPEDVFLALDALDTAPSAQKPVIINAIGTWLAGERNKVNQGHAIDEKAQTVFTNEVLLSTLVDQLQTEVPMKQKAIDMLPEKIRRVMSSATDTFDAADCLVLIEDPALAYVQANTSRLGSSGVTLEQDIKIAISTREIRHPGSTWYSSAGNPEPRTE